MDECAVVASTAESSVSRVEHETTGRTKNGEAMPCSSSACASAESDSSAPATVNGCQRTQNYRQINNVPPANQPNPTVRFPCSSVKSS